MSQCCLILQVVESFGCQLVEGVLTHEQKRFVLDGNKCVLNRPGPDARVDDHDFLENEVYAVDIVVATGEGKTRVSDQNIRGPTSSLAHAGRKEEKRIGSLAGSAAPG